MESQPTARARSPPIRPARPDGEIDGSLARPRSSEVPSRGPSTSRRLRKQPMRSDVRASSDAHSWTRKRKSARYSADTNGTTAERTGSIRNAVRRLFGRKSKEGAPAVPRIEYPRHAYHKSDPGHFTRPHTIDPHIAEAISHRVISAPIAGPLLDPHSFILQEPPPPKVQGLGPSSRSSPRSPNAVEFPKSARLKPLDLGNPFYTRVHGPKRRATLPSLIMTDREVEKIATLLKTSSDTRVVGTSFDADRQRRRGSETSGETEKKAKMGRRRSRSANDLRPAITSSDPFRQRTDEIEYWRRSYASVTVTPTGKPSIYDHSHLPIASDFREVSALPEITDISEIPEISDIPDLLEIPEVPEIPDVADKPDVPNMPVIVPVTTVESEAMDVMDQEHVQPASGPAARKPSLHGRSFSRPLPPPPQGETSADLEARVAKLEAGLLDFQRSLSSLAFSNASLPAVSLGPPPRSLHREQTPSILVETLHAQPRFEDAGDILEREWGPSSRNSAAERDRPAPPIRTPSGFRTNNSGNFSALYSMMSEERSARRTLEHQVRTLQHEVTRLQLSRGSWGSYQNPVNHRPRTPEESERGDSRQEAYNTLNSPATVVPPASFLRAFDGPGDRIVSRFSGDSGETSDYSRHRSVGYETIGGFHRSQTPPPDPAITPYEHYRTPAEERNPYRFGEDEMF